MRQTLWNTAWLANYAQLGAIKPQPKMSRWCLINMSDRTAGMFCATNQHKREEENECEW